MLWNDSPIHTPSGERLYLRYLALYQPYWVNGTLRAMLAEKPFGQEPPPAMFLCERNDKGEWIATKPALSLRDESYHPDLDDHDNEFITIAREVIEAIGSDASIRIALDTRQDSDYKHNRIGHVFFSRPGMTDERALNLIPGVRALEYAAETFWDTVGATNFDDGGLEGEFEFEIKAHSTCLSYQPLDPEEFIAFTSSYEDGAWHHKTEMVLIPEESPTVIDEMKQLRDGPIRIFHDRFPKTKFASAFSNHHIKPGDIINHEFDNHEHTLQLRPGALRGDV